MTEIRYVQRDETGKIVGHYANPQYGKKKAALLVAARAAHESEAAFLREKFKDDVAGLKKAIAKNDEEMKARTAEIHATVPGYAEEALPADHPDILAFKEARKPKPEPMLTPEEKLARAGLNVEDLKVLLGLS